MKFGLQLLAILLLASVLELFLPWWSIAIAAFTCGFFLKSKANFLAGFLGIGLLWFATAWVMDLNAATPLAEKVSQILMINSKWLLLLVTALVGGLVGGLASLTGSLLRTPRKAEGHLRM